MGSQRVGMETKAGLKKFFLFFRINGKGKGSQEKRMRDPVLPTETVPWLCSAELEPSVQANEQGGWSTLAAAPKS